MATTAQRMRAWQGPVIFSHGFRPFFLGAGLWAALAMLLWIPMMNGRLTLPSAFDPVSWHAHEFLFGYLGAVMAGFLMTAVPNWTGRLPIVGWPLAALWVLWGLGRVAVAVSAYLPPLVVGALDLAFPLALSLAIGREIVIGRNWRNLIVLAMLAVFLLGNGLFHLEAAQGDFAAQGVGFRVGLGAGIMMIAVIGGRIVPSFTRNWLAQRGGGPLPVPPMQRFDRYALLLLLVALLCWAGWPEGRVSGVAFVLVAGVHLVRLQRWRGKRTFAEPLVFVLHAGYFFLPFGALVMGVAILTGGASGVAGAQHLWMAGAIGLMTLAVMTRATLGHTGQALTAGPATVGIFLSLGAAALLRLSAGVWPQAASGLLMLAALAWVFAFGGFALVYGRLLLRRPPARMS